MQILNVVTEEMDYRCDSCCDLIFWRDVRSVECPECGMGNTDLCRTCASNPKFTDPKNWQPCEECQKPTVS